MKRGMIIKLTGMLLFFAGLFILSSSKNNLTGAFIGVSAQPAFFFNNLMGLLFILSGIILFAAMPQSLEKITLSSAIKKNTPLLRLTQDAVENQTVERELNHLVRELSKGNFEAGLGHPGHINRTDIFYLRGRNGARLYYHKIGENNYEIVAKSAKGRNQDQVIDRLEEVYGN